MGKLTINGESAIVTTDPRLTDARPPLYHTHNYLPLSGGTLTGDLLVQRSNSEAKITLKASSASYHSRLFLDAGASNKFAMVNYGHSGSQV